jgi:hypothetical protein
MVNLSKREAVLYSQVRFTQKAFYFMRKVCEFCEQDLLLKSKKENWALIGGIQVFDTLNV